MKTLEIESKKSMFPVFAATRARIQNNNNRSTYSQKERDVAQTAFDLLDEVYAYENMYINYRKTFISIKIDSPLVRDRKLLREIESVLEERHVVKVKSPQGVLYRMGRC